MEKGVPVLPSSPCFSWWVQPTSQAEGVLRKTLELKVFCNRDTRKDFPGAPGDFVQIQIPTPRGRSAVPPCQTAARQALPAQSRAHHLFRATALPEVDAMTTYW